MQFWEEIINTALLGTDKRAVAVAQLPEGLAVAAGRIAGGNVDKEEQFLQLAAVAFNYRQSGVLPLQQEGIELPIALPEELPYCSGRAVQLLKEIMEDDLTALLDYWMKTCIRARKIVVPDMIPGLLNKSVNHTWMQLLVGDVCGRRGEWVRGFNPSWQFGGGSSSDEEFWETGTGVQRAAVLRRWRLEDAAKAREKVASVWAQENANGKVELLRQLSGTVSGEDVAWLEGLLGEKSAKVKEEALSLLAQAPGSAVVEKNWAVVRAGVYLKKERALLGMVNKTSFVVELKDLSLIGMVPPVYWEGHLGTDAAGVIAYFQKEDKTLLPLLASAIARFSDKRWAAAFLAADQGYYPDVVALWEGDWSMELARTVLKHTARQPYQFTVSFYKERIVQLPAGIVAELDKFAPPEPHLKAMWDKLSEQIKRLMSLKEQVSKAFN